MPTTKIISIEEVKSLPIGSIVYLKKDGYWMACKYRIAEKNGCTYLEGVHTKRMLAISEKRLFHFEVPIKGEKE